MRDFKTTAQVLVDTYNDGRLKAVECARCAVGQIVASCNFNVDNRYWGSLFTTNWTDGTQKIDKHQENNPFVKSNIVPTGYDWKELARIEYAFEMGAQGNQTLCKGLSAAIDVLADIHNASPLEVEQIKQQIKGTHGND